MKFFIDNNTEFAELRDLRNKIDTPDSVYAPNYLTWIGGSIMMSLSTGNEPVKESERFLVTAEQYEKENQTIQDRFGDAFLNFNRASIYFNKTFEINLRLAKYSDVQSNVSNRTYETRK